MLPRFLLILLFIWAGVGHATSSFDEFFDSRQSYRTDGLVVLHHGRVIFERYANGYDARRPHLLWSCAKSVTGLLFGIAEMKGILLRNDRVDSVLPELKREGEPLRWHHILHMSSGIDWDEGYESAPWKSDVIRMLYLESSMPRFVMGKTFRTEPDARFYYSSGETNLIMEALQRRMPRADYDRYPWTVLFEPLGISSAVWERDSQGVYVGSSYLYMAPLDFAQIGQLILQKGMWKGRVIVPSEWIRFSIELAPAFERTAMKEPAQSQSYGAQWWLNRASPIKKTTRPYPDVPEDMMLAVGHHGQYLAVLPSDDTVVVRTGFDRHARIDLNRLLQVVLHEVRR